MKCPEPWNREQSYCGTYTKEENEILKDEKIAVHVASKSPLFKANEQSIRYIVHPDAKSVSVKERLKVEHVGHRIKDFSRGELMWKLKTSNAIPLVPMIRVRVPETAKNFKFTDVNGLVWTFTQRKSGFYDLQPRFPLLSGWKFEFEYSFDSNLSEYHTKGDEYKFPKTGLVHQVIADKGHVEIVLPEDADLQSNKNRKYTIARSLFLSTLGEKIYTVNAKHKVLNTNESVKLAFTIPKYAQFRKPLIGMILAMAIWIFSARLCFGDSDPNRLEIEYLLEERKSMILEGMETDKLDSQILHHVDDNHRSGLSQILKRPVNHLNVDQLTEEVRLHLFE